MKDNKDILIEPSGFSRPSDAARLVALANSVGLRVTQADPADTPQTSDENEQPMNLGQPRFLDGSGTCTTASRTTRTDDSAARRERDEWNRAVEEKKAAKRRAKIIKKWKA
jgi:hypothetical protein